MDRVLMIHNTFGAPDDALYESRAGVMDQVGAVAEAMDRLGIAYETAAVEDLRHLTQTLTERQAPILVNLAEEFLCAAEQACYVPAVCRAFGRECTGNDTGALLLSQNKIQAKAILRDAGLPCPAGTAVYPGQGFDAAQVPPGRYIFKPACSDASEGITSASVLDLPAEADRARELAAGLHAQFGQPVVIEQFIGARELNVSVTERAGKAQVMPLAEIDFGAFAAGQVRIVDYDAKWTKDSFGYHNTPRKIPADLPPEAARRVEALALAAWRALGCRDYARVDFRLDEELNPYILEINPNPDISPDAGFAAALEAGGVRYEQFVNAMLENAQRRLTKAR